MRKGFERVATEMPDIQLDLPNAPAAFGDFRKQVHTRVLMYVKCGREHSRSASGPGVRLLASM